MTRPARGFTLLELLIAMAIFAVLSALAYGGLNQLLASADHTRQANRQLRDLQLAVSILTQDLAQLAARPIRDEYGAERAALEVGDDGITLLRFTRRGWRNPTGLRRSTLQRVAYRLEDGTLYRRYWHHLDRAPGEQPVELPLLTGVRALRVRLRDGSGRWQDAWPPLDLPPGTKAVLPRAIAVTLDTERWGEITRRLTLVEGGQ